MFEVTCKNAGVYKEILKLNIKTKTITLLAVSLALMFALTPIPFVSLFLVPLLFLGCTQKWYIATIGGLMFGLVSLMYSFVVPVGIVAYAFMAAPWIPIVPRIFVGLVTAFAFSGFRRLFKGKGKMSRILPYNLAATIGTLTNTVLVVGSFYIMRIGNPYFPVNFYGHFDILFLGQIAIFAAIELVVANLIAAPVSFGVARGLRVGEFTPVLNANINIKVDEFANANNFGGTNLDNTENDSSI